MEEKTLEVSVAKFMELCRTDARMDALISKPSKRLSACVTNKEEGT